MTKHEKVKFKIKKVRENDAVLNNGVIDDRLICVEQEIDGESHDFYFFKTKSNGELKTAEEIVNEYRMFAAERLRAWGKKVKATVHDIDFEGEDILEAATIGHLKGHSIAKQGE